MKQIYLLNGPNLNMLGKRDPGHYGHMTLAEIEQQCVVKGHEMGFDVHCYQSNYEGGLVDKIHEAHENAQGLIINPGAYSHTSIALRDALSILSIPVIEVHLSNIMAREAFRHHSWVSEVATGSIVGLGDYGYILALNAIQNRLENKK